MYIDGKGTKVQCEYTSFNIGGLSPAPTCAISYRHRAKGADGKGGNLSPPLRKDPRQSFMIIRGSGDLHGRSRGRDVTVKDDNTLPAAFSLQRIWVNTSLGFLSLDPEIGLWNLKQAKQNGLWNLHDETSSLGRYSAPLWPAARAGWTARQTGLAGQKHISNALIFILLLSLLVCVYTSLLYNICIHICISLSLYIYIYIYLCTHIQTITYVNKHDNKQHELNVNKTGLAGLPGVPGRAAWAAPTITFQTSSVALFKH